MCFFLKQKLIRWKYGNFKIMINRSLSFIGLIIVHIVPNVIYFQQLPLTRKHYSPVSPHISFNSYCLCAIQSIQGCCKQGTYKGVVARSVYRERRLIRKQIFRFITVLVLSAVTGYIILPTACATDDGVNSILYYSSYWKNMLEKYMLTHLMNYQTLIVYSVYQEGLYNKFRKTIIFNWQPVMLFRSQFHKKTSSGIRFDYDHTTSEYFDKISQFFFNRSEKFGLI